MAGPVQERCGSCGAAVDIEALACAYCGAPSPHAVRAKKARDEAELAREEDEIRNAQASLDRSGTYAVVWSVVGLVTCCFPFGSAVGLAMALKARKTALHRDWIPPAKATVALVLSGVSLLCCIGFWTLVVVDMRKQDARRDQLRAYVTEHAGEDPLTQNTACSIAELHLLEEGYGEHGRTAAGRAFQCAGRLKLDGERGRLEDVSFKPSGKKDRVHLDACLRHGGRWYVRTMVEAGADCDENAATSTTANE